MSFTSFATYIIAVPIQTLVGFERAMIIMIEIEIEIEIEIVIEIRTSIRISITGGKNKQATPV